MKTLKINKYWQAGKGLTESGKPFKGYSAVSLTKGKPYAKVTGDIQGVRNGAFGDFVTVGGAELALNQLTNPVIAQQFGLTVEML